MAGRSEVERIEKHNTCFFPLALFLLVGGFVALQSYGFSELSPFGSYNGSRLCHFVPESDSCTPTTANSTLSKGEKALNEFVWFQAFCLLIQIVAFALVCSRILTCAWFCVKCCFECWQTACIPCGHLWIVLETLSGLMSLAVAIYLGVSLSVEEVRKINGFVPCVINGVFEILKTIGYIYYEHKVGCPPTDIFFGTNKKFSDARISVRLHRRIDANGHETRRLSHTLHV